MSDSPLVSYTKLSPNNSGTRTHTIDRITPHCIVGQLSVESAGAWFAKPSTQASCNYVIGADGRVGLIVPESKRSWCSSSRENDQRAVTIECASDKTDPYAFRDAVYQKLIQLCADICRRNGKTKLLWLGDRTKTLVYVPAPGEMVLTVHRWYASKDCPGNWLMARMPYLASRVTELLGTPNIPAPSAGTTSAMEINALGSEVTKAKAMLKLVHDTDQSGILPSVTTAQMILESGYCSTDLALNANNCFGMKAVLSGNAWGGSTWDGVSTYKKTTAEQTASGRVYYVRAKFRKYPCVEKSIQDHSAYLLGAMKGTAKRYRGLTEAGDYREAIHIIKAGGYATDVHYESKICSIIERYGLDAYDAHKPRKTTYIVQAGAYTDVQKAAEALADVRKVVPDAYLRFDGGMQKIQAGAFSVKENAEKTVQELTEAGIDAFIREV